MPIGAQLHNRYRITSILGQGGFGIVYAGATFSGQRVAIKQNLDDSAEGREQFRREADLLRQLTHKNLVRVEDYFQDERGRQFLVMQFIPGADLWQLAEQRSNPFPETQVLEWGVLLCDALAYLHTRVPPIIHRDIKPHNVKLEQPSGRLVLVDFGIAKEFRAGQQTILGARACTDGFSPLEQYGTGTIPLSDLYALGATLFFLLTLKVPVTATERAINPHTFDLAQLNPTLAPRTVQAIHKAMEVDARNRFPNALEMQHALTHALESLEQTGGLPLAPTAPTQVARAVCASCGATNRGNARFCQTCGKSLTARAAEPGITCAQCGARNRHTARVCQQCGKPLISPPLLYPVPPPKPARVAAPAVAPKPVPVPRATTESRIAGGILIFVGVLALFAGAETLSMAWFPILGIILVGLGFFSTLAGRDLTGFLTPRQGASGWLALALGDANRGRRWGTVLAIIWIILGVATGWLIAPLVLVGAMTFALNLLTSETLVRAVGGHYTRPGGVTIIGVLLACSGIGTVPGIALLVPKRWALKWSKLALAALVPVALVGIGVGVMSLGMANPPAPLDFVVPGVPMRVRVIALGLVALSLATIPACIFAIWYLDQVRLDFTPTAMRREVNVAAWTLFAAGISVILGSLAQLNAPSIGGVYAAGIGVGVAALWSANDLLRGNLARGRRNGVIVAVGLALLAIALAYQIAPLAFLGVAIFLLRILTSAQAILVCGGKPRTPAGLGLIGGLLAFTLIGLPATRWLNRADARGLTLTRVLLAVLFVLGLASAIWCGSTVWNAWSRISPWTLMATSCSIALVIGTGIALNYLGSPSVRRYFRV